MRVMVVGGGRAEGWSSEPESLKFGQARPALAALALHHGRNLLTWKLLPLLPSRLTLNAP